MGIAEMEGDLLIFDNDVLNSFFFFLPIVKITAQLKGKIAVHTHHGGVKRLSVT